MRDRDAATWLLASVLSVAWLAATAWVLRAEAVSSDSTHAAVLLGGWSLTLLPVHCARRLRRTAVPAAPAAPAAHDEGVGRDESPPTPPRPWPSA